MNHLQEAIWPSLSKFPDTYEIMLDHILDSILGGGCLECKEDEEIPKGISVVVSNDRTQGLFRFREKDKVAMMHVTIGKPYKYDCFQVFQVSENRRFKKDNRWK
jgi:hypothetical protein